MAIINISYPTFEGDAGYNYDLITAHISGMSSTYPDNGKFVCKIDNKTFTYTILPWSTDNNNKTIDDVFYSKGNGDTYQARVFIDISSVPAGKYNVKFARYYGENDNRPQDTYTYNDENETTTWGDYTINNFEKEEGSEYPDYPEPDPPPDNWTWSNKALTAFKNHGKVTELTYAEWNEFIDRIVEFLDYNTISYKSSDVSAAKASSSDKSITAVRFNKANELIKKMISTGIDE